ncbi:MAG TPA: alpha/beta hydrolase [Candidatus Limnocylindrales bacterium]
MRTLSVQPRILHDVADRLDRLALECPPRRGDLLACLSDLEDAWSGGLAAPMAVESLRRLIDLSMPSVSAMDGLPIAERDRINRTYFAGHPALDSLSGYLNRGDAWLLGFDPRGDGRLIVAFGDPSSAPHLATFVPGAGASLTQISGELERAVTLRERAGEGTSVIMWLGYDPPDFADAILQRSARDAAAPLRAFQNGLVSNHDGPIQQLTLIGHSYGSVVVGVAGRTGSLPADDLIVLGSPGMGVGSAADLPARVWASTAPNDPIRLAPPIIHGPDPISRGFGARTFPSAPMGHSGYFHPTNPALDTMASVATDRL